jgi:hypothetical protein
MRRALLAVALLLSVAVSARAQLQPGTALPVNVTTLPTLTKGTQGATGVSIQELHDAGRTMVTFTADNVVPILTARIRS